MDERLKKIQQRTIQYWFVDGLAEIAWGLLGLLIALIFLWQQFYPIPGWGDMTYILVVVVIALAMREFLERTKEHSTYPRSGYVTYKGALEDKGALAIALIFTLGMLGLNFYLALWDEAVQTMMPATGGLMFAFIFVWAGYKAGLRRLYFLALFCLLAGAGFSLSGVGDLMGSALLSASTGFLLLIYGILTRRAYLRQADSLSEAPDDRD